VIRAHGICNGQVKPGDLILYGIAYPGTYVTDTEGFVITKSFNGSFKMRDSPEALFDDAVVLGPARDDDEVRNQIPCAAERGRSCRASWGVGTQHVIRPLGVGLWVISFPRPVGSALVVVPQPGGRVPDGVLPMSCTASRRPTRVAASG
jgi:hypothetical protein